MKSHEVTTEEYLNAPVWYREMIDIPNQPAHARFTESCNSTEAVNTAAAIQRGDYRYLFPDNAPLTDRRDVIARAARTGLLGPHQIIDAFLLYQYQEEFDAIPQPYPLFNHYKTDFSEPAKSILLPHLFFDDTADISLFKTFREELPEAGGQYFFTIDISLRRLQVILLGYLDRMLVYSSHSSFAKAFERVFNNPVMRRLPGLDGLYENCTNILAQPVQADLTLLLIQLEECIQDLKEELAIDLTHQEKLPHALAGTLNQLFSPCGSPTSSSGAALVILPTRLLLTLNFVYTGSKDNAIDHLPVMGEVSRDKLRWCLKKRNAHVVQLFKPGLNNPDNADDLGAGPAMFTEHDRIAHGSILTAIPKTHRDVFIQIDGFLSSVKKGLYEEFAWKFTDMEFWHYENHAASEQRCEAFARSVKKVFANNPEQPPESIEITEPLLIVLIWLKINWQNIQLDFSWESFARMCVKDACLLDPPRQRHVQPWSFFKFFHESFSASPGRNYFLAIIAMGMQYYLNAYQNMMRNENGQEQIKIANDLISDIYVIDGKMALKLVDEVLMVKMKDFVINRHEADYLTFMLEEWKNHRTHSPPALFAEGERAINSYFSSR